MRIWLDKTVDEEFEDLGTSGHTGTLNDRQFTFLATLGHTGSLADRMGSFIAGGRVVDTTAPVVVTSTYDNGTGALALNITEASGSATCYWALVANPSTPTTAQVKAGTGGGILEAGSFTVTSGGDSDTISLVGPTGNELHLVIEDASGNNTGTPSAGNNTVITGVSIPSPILYEEDFQTDVTANPEFSLSGAGTITADTTGTCTFTTFGTDTGLQYLSGSTNFVYQRMLLGSLTPGNTYRINWRGAFEKNSGTGANFIWGIEWMTGGSVHSDLVAATTVAEGGATTVWTQAVEDIDRVAVCPAGADGLRLRVGYSNSLAGVNKVAFAYIKIEDIT